MTKSAHFMIFKIVNKKSINYLNIFLEYALNIITIIFFENKDYKNI